MTHQQIKAKKHVEKLVSGMIDRKRICRSLTGLFEWKSILMMLCILAFLTFNKTYSQAAEQVMAMPTIILVHGLWADGSSWSKVIPSLIKKGYHVISVQNPTTSIEDDVAATTRAIESVKGDVILVGHSWGGFVISEAGNHPQVKALVYVAAYAPDKGETVITLSQKAAPTQLQHFLETIDGSITLTKEGVQKVFANDLTADEQDLVYSVQPPAFPKVFEAIGTNVAWKQKPSWYIVASGDNTINPELEKIMAARAKAHTVVLQTNHVAMLSKPKEVTEVILEAATQFGQ